MFRILIHKTGRGRESEPAQIFLHFLDLDLDLNPDPDSMNQDPETLPTFMLNFYVLSVATPSTIRTVLILKR